MIGGKFFFYPKSILDQVIAYQRENFGDLRGNRSFSIFRGNIGESMKATWNLPQHVIWTIIYRMACIVKHMLRS